jgi:hypothetical protein
MKKLLLLLCLLFLPVFMTAQSREALLTPDGTLFTIDTHVNEPGSLSAAHLVLRVQRGSEIVPEIVPATLEEGAHMQPAIAYDADAKMLFVFWLRYTGLTGSQLMFACRDANGTWGDARVFGERFNPRDNLRVTVTRKVTDDEGHVSSGVSVHLVWWEFDTDDGSESARYAMIPIENGQIVGEPQRLVLDSLVTKPSADDVAPEAIDTAVLKQPLLFSSPSQDSVLVVFGELGMNRLHQVRIKPIKTIVSDGRLRVPVGREEGNGVGAPHFASASNARVEGLYGNSDRIALYTRGNDRLDYVIMKDGAWSETRAITLDTEITSGAAVDALRRLLNEH